MADVFISYAHTTSKQAQAAAAALRAGGYSVWLDDDLAVHRGFTQAIEEQLTAAKAALVIWSADAARSQWVLSEANRAREDGKLVQLVIDKTRLPMPFDQVQCAELTGWTGEGEHPNWRRVSASIGELVGSNGATLPAPPAAALAPPAASTDPLLAVLAFDNLSGDPEMAYFSDGVSEEIQQTVARGADLKVIGRASSFQFRGADKAAARIAQALGATHVLDGSVRRAGSRVRISAQLVECRAETSLWSDRYDRDLTDIFALQDEIAAAVAQALKATFARSQPAAPIDPTAYDLFLRANAFAGAPDFDTIRQRLEMYEAVVAGAPAFARGWAALAHGRAQALWLHPEPAAAAGLKFVHVRQAAETALRLDPHMGLAHQALAILEPWAAYRAREALNEKALAATPNDAQVLVNAGTFSGAVGRMQTALAQIRRAYELDPLLPVASAALAVMYRHSGQLDASNGVMDAALARWPDSATIAVGAMMGAALVGDRAKAEGLMRDWPFDTDANQVLREGVRWARNLLDPDPASIKTILEEQRDALATTGTVSLMEAAMLYRLDLVDEAYELIDQASFAHLFQPEGTPPAGGWFPGVIFHASYGLHRDPRFPRLCAKLGLADYWVETGQWPDCADDVSYDFRAEVRRAASTA